MYFLLKMWAFFLPLWAYVLVGFCPGGFCPRGFCPRGFCPTLLQHNTHLHRSAVTALIRYFDVVDGGVVIDYFHENNEFGTVQSPAVAVPPNRRCFHTQRHRLCTGTVLSSVVGRLMYETSDSVTCDASVRPSKSHR